jgi:hypothetical protein
MLDRILRDSGSDFAEVSSGAALFASTSYDLPTHLTTGEAPQAFPKKDGGGSGGSSILKRPRVRPAVASVDGVDKRATASGARASVMRTAFDKVGTARARSRAQNGCTHMNVRLF